MTHAQPTPLLIHRQENGKKYDYLKITSNPEGPITPPGSPSIYSR